MIAHKKELEDFVLQARGNKICTNSQEGDEDLEPENPESTENLRMMLSFERIAFSNKISEGIYEVDKNRVRITSVTGRWNAGYIEECVKYLKPFEALQLIEMGRLKVTFDSVIMSVEQAYAIFLDPCNDVLFEEYLVYSNLIRCGYIVFQYNYDSDCLKYESLQKNNIMKVLNKEDEMIWCVLMEKLNLPFSANFVNEEFQLYQQTKNDSETLNDRISGERLDATGEVVELKKRELSPVEELSSKRHKSIDDDPQDESFLDILKSEVEYCTHENIFKRFSFIKRENDLTPEKTLKFNFDVFVPRNKFKKSEDLPNYRLLIVK